MPSTSGIAAASDATRYSPGATNQNYLRGVQAADGSGNVTFTSIFPGCYAGRSAANLSRVSLASDMVFSDGSALELATIGGSVSGGLTATLTVAV